MKEVKRVKESNLNKAQQKEKENSKRKRNKRRLLLTYSQKTTINPLGSKTHFELQANIYFVVSTEVTIYILQTSDYTDAIYLRSRKRKKEKNTEINAIRSFYKN